MDPAVTRAALVRREDRVSCGVHRDDPSQEEAKRDKWPSEALVFPPPGRIPVEILDLTSAMTWMVCPDLSWI